MITAIFSSRSNSIATNKTIFEESVNIAVSRNYITDNKLQMEEKKIVCRRYSMPITYNKEECASRYGNDVAFDERKHKIIAVIPQLSDDMKKYEGVMYSFLPTQIKIQAPLILHVPYKLDGSREFVDPQGTNLWFRHTTAMLGEFLKVIYIHLSREIKQEIVRYLPRSADTLFKQDNEKTRCLDLDCFNAQEIIGESVFYCTDGTFTNGEGIVCFGVGDSDRRDDFEAIYGMIGEERKLFIPPNANFDMRVFGVKILSDINRKLFYAGLRNERIFKEAVAILEKSKKDIEYYKFFEEVESGQITLAQLNVLVENPRLLEGYNKMARARIASEKCIPFVFENGKEYKDPSFSGEIKELIEATELATEFEKYLVNIHYQISTIEIDKREFYLPFDNTLLLSQKSKLSSFASLSGYYDPRNTFSSTLKIRQASIRLNDASEDMSNADYLKLLRDVRLSLINAFGKKSYDSYISIVNKSGTDKNRFLSELLQNADDCCYDKACTPEFKLKISGKKLIVEYNEEGFTKDNVRAITAIGESTKKLLLNGEDKSIGEKGVGFKSVFGVAKSVEIHSNGFDFLLSSEKPTIPEKCSSNKNIKGTKMIYELKDDTLRDFFIEDNIIPLCLCLRKIKKLNINGIEIQIVDGEKNRTITVNEKEYILEKYRYDFEILDDEAVNERYANHETISDNQYIAYYILPKNFKLKICNLYTGLPVSKIECQIPLVIDAPFELTTARDDVLQSRWNEVIREALYDGIIELIDYKKTDMRIDVLKYANYQVINGENCFLTFDNQYLNQFSWYKSLKGLDLLPSLNSDAFLKADRNAYVVPDIIAEVVKKGCTYRFRGNVIDTLHKSQYQGLLKFLGCEFLEMYEQLQFISENVKKYLNNKKDRENLYKFLSTNRDKFEQKSLGRQICDLPIYPIRTESGTSYAKYSGNLYTHDSQISSSEYLILDTETLSYKLCQSILGLDNRINVLSQEVFDAKYRDNIETLIQSRNKSEEEIGKYLLHEFKHNRKAFEKCILSLKGLLDQIPMKMNSGIYKRGSKFNNADDWFFVGNILPDMYIADEYKEFATFLGLDDILSMHYSDIDCETDDGITDDEIQDILDHFNNSIDILSGLISDGTITDDQIERFNLQFFENSLDSYSDEDDDYEPFPGRRIKNIALLRYHIDQIFYDSPNPYVKKVRYTREPMYKVDKVNYTDSMYRSTVNNKKCFCQMCGDRFLSNYIERNDVQVRPKYGWEQMYLSLCPMCSKDYIYLRNVNSIWKAFIQNIVKTKIDTRDENVEIDIANRSITFTAVHLAEIQRILQLEASDVREFGDNVIQDEGNEDSKGKTASRGKTSDSFVEKSVKKKGVKNKKDNNTFLSDVVENPKHKVGMVEGVDCIFKAIRVAYSTEKVSYDKEKRLIASTSFKLSLLDTVIHFNRESMDQDVVIRMALESDGNQSVRFNARKVKVNGHMVCEKIEVYIPDYSAKKQIVTFALPIDVLPHVNTFQDIDRISFYIEADADISGNDTHVESDAVIFGTNGDIRQRIAVRDYR